MSDIPNFERVKDYFEERLTAHGATAPGVDWNSKAAQDARFFQLAKVIRPETPFSLIDYGSGCGAFADYLLQLNFPLQTYCGYDVLESMTEKAAETHAHLPQCRFTSRFADLIPVDYSVACGIFNLKLETPFDAWTEYVVAELGKMDRLSLKGFSFNMLTKYSDEDHMRPRLYYADPGFFFDYCKRNFSRNVALLHDYDLYDFTVIVRKIGE